MWTALNLAFLLTICIDWLQVYTKSSLQLSNGRSCCGQVLHQMKLILHLLAKLIKTENSSWRRLLCPSPTPATVDDGPEWQIEDSVDHTAIKRGRKHKVQHLVKLFDSWSYGGAAV